MARIGDVASIRESSDKLALIGKGRAAQGRVPGEWGMWTLLLGDMTLFSAYFVCIALLRTNDPDAYRQAQAHLHPSFGVVNTVLLVTASLLVVRGLDAVRNGRVSGSRSFAGALLCAVAFMANKLTEYGLLLDSGSTLTTSKFFTYYYMFTGIHLTHAVIGAVLLWRMSILARRAGNLTRYQLSFLECGAGFWHMVDLLWLVLFPLLYFV